LYERLIDGAPAAGSAPLFEEKIVVIEAQDEALARQIASAHGVQGSENYQNEFGERVDWRFVKVIDVKQLFDEALRDGTEVFYRFLTQTEADVLLNAVSAPIDHGSEG
jgi:hypothetical protein